MQLVQNVIIVTLCVDSRHTFFTTFCVNGIRSVSNDKHFVSCYDRWHNYSIVLIFDELLIFLFFFINIAVGFRLFVIHRRSQSDIFLLSKVKYLNFVITKAVVNIFAEILHAGRAAIFMKH